MSLKNSIPNFNDSIVRIEAGRKILNEYIKPLLANSTAYYKISSFFTPSVIKSVFLQLDQCFRQKEQVKLIIGIHDSYKLIPVLDEIDNPNREEKFKLAVQSIVSKGIEECVALTDNPQGFLFVFSELIKQNLIQIKIASVKSDFIAYLRTGRWPENDSTFHPKVSIFKDDNHTVVMSGSVNSTNKGFGENVEEASFVGSWFSPAAVSFYEKSFFEIWEGRHQDSHTLEFNNDIKQIINSIIQRSEVYRSRSDIDKSFSYQNLQHVINDSPLFFQYSFQKVRLLPHQYAVYRSALSRWPIVTLIADEVGLGKTIEAGATIKYLKRFFSINRTALLIPSSLRNQWQTEMYNLFELEFYIYDSNSKSLVFAPNNELIDIIPNVDQGNYFDHGVSNIIFSWHYLRSNRNGEFKLTDADNIDLVVVDEAHGARLSGEMRGEFESTLLYQFLEQLLVSVPHKLLLTATPFQTNSLDYLALLRLLMGSNNIDESSLKRIASLNANQSFVNQQKVDAVLELINDTTYEIKGITPDINTSDLPSLFDAYSDDIYLSNHPTTIYTLRNTRDTLKQVGYEFPAVQLDSESIELNKKQKNIFRLATNYVENNLFELESVLGLKGIGFVRNIYHQRIVSSLKACHDTLSNRLKRLVTYINEGSIDGEINDSSDDELSDEIVVANALRLTDSEISIAQSESAFIEEILQRIEKLIGNTEISDPKIDRVIFLVKKHLLQGDKIIVFSRFTSTTDFIVQKMINVNEYSIGRYQGNLKQFIKNHEIVNVDRQTISEMFSNGHFPVIVCSDAASEGLNLQTANVIINVDVPWNPARLLQRFGRVDRFGQKKKHIYFYNLFYPDTVEDRMYSRLHRRNTEFREILGATPDITSEGHIRDLQFREFLNADNRRSFSYKNSLIALSSEDNIRLHTLILDRLDALPGVYRDSNTINYFGHIFPYSLNEIDPDYLDLNHKLFNFLKPKRIEHPETLFELINSKGHVLFYCIKSGKRIYPIYLISEILDYLVGDKRLERNGESEYIEEHALQEGVHKIISNPANKFVDHTAIIFNSSRNEIYDGLKIRQSDFKIDCVFDT